MYICVSLKTVNFATSGVNYDADDNLHDLFAQDEFDRITVNEIENSYYQFLDNHIFTLMDALEQSLPTIGHDVCWDWTGVRKEGDYYLLLEVMALPKETFRFWNAFNRIFPGLREQSEPFEMPEIDHPFNFDDLEGQDEDDDYDECDEESCLRDLEMLTVGIPVLQWERRPMEYGGGAGIIATIGVAAGVGSFGYTFLKDFAKAMMKNHYSRKIEHLKRKVIKKCNNEGRIIPPEPEAPKVYNMERNEYEYEFTQLLNDGSKNRVFIGVDSGIVTSIPHL